MDTRRDIVIVGAGIFGSAVAYALARRGLGERVLLLDRQPPASGATSLAAALVTLARDKTHWIPLAQETYVAMADLAQRFGADVGRHTVGALHVAPAALMDPLRAFAARCVPHGVEHVELDRTQALRRARWLSPAAFDGAILFPQEAYVDGYQLSSAYLRAAQAEGARLHTGADVSAVRCTGGAVGGVTLADGTDVPARVVAIAAGAWSNRLSAPLGAPLPLAPVRSQYWITAPAPAFDRDGSIVLMPEIGAYARPEVGGLLFGVREARSVAADYRSLPASLSGFVFDPSDPDGWNNLSAAAEPMTRYAPVLADTGIAHYVTGPSCYTVDGELVVGPIDGVDGLFCAGGCNGGGIAVSGGIGRLVAELVTGTPPWIDPTPHRPQRLGAFDPAAAAFVAACGAARSRKTSG